MYSTFTNIYILMHTRTYSPLISLTSISLLISSYFSFYICLGIYWLYIFQSKLMKLQSAHHSEWSVSINSKTDI